MPWGLSCEASRDAASHFLHPLCRSKSPKALPLVKFIDTFEAAFGLIANNGSVWTINTDLNAPRSK